MKNMKFIFKLAAILFLIAFICSLLLVLCNTLTKDRILELQQKAENEARIEVLADASDFEKLHSSDKVDEAYIGKDSNGDTAGYCFKVSPSGFNGKITMIVGITKDGVISGVKITDMAETPGLGAKSTDEAWTAQFKGKTDKIEVVKTGNAKGNQINAISGATITSRAVAEGVNIALGEAQTLIKEGK